MALFLTSFKVVFMCLPSYRMENGNEYLFQAKDAVSEVVL